MATTVALIGAGGKMGMRIARNLARSSEYEVLYAETGEQGVARLAGLGLGVTPGEDAVARAGIIVLAVPDALIRDVSRKLVPKARPGATVILLDPAAAMAGDVETRDGLGYVVTHPCHPPLFGDQPTEEARKDFFGGTAAWQDIVVALMRGSEGTYAAAEALCREMFAPVRNAHRLTVEQIALLEPAMAEVVAASAAVLMKEALEEAVRRGVPRAAAESFMLGHAQIPLAIVFGAVASPFSDGAKVAIRWGTERVIRDDWRRVFEPDQVRAVIGEMLAAGRRP
jgi:hypothetical protein